MIIIKRPIIGRIVGVLIIQLLFLSSIYVVAFAQSAQNQSKNNSSAALISNNPISALLSIVIIIVLIIIFIIMHIYDNKLKMARSIKDAQIESKTKKIPIGVLKYITIRITNNQTTSTLQNYQQMLKLDLSYYKKYINKNIDNMLFFDSEGKALKSWLESYSKKDFSNMVFWVFINSQINASSYFDINLAFLAMDSKSDNNYGIAPNMTEKYGSMDNGSSIFDEYWNFELNYLQSEWLNSSKCDYSLNKGLKINNGSVYTNECMYNPSNYVLEASVRFSYINDVASSGISISESRHMGAAKEITRPAVMLLCNSLSKKYAGLTVLASNGAEGGKSFNIQNEHNMYKISYDKDYIFGISATQEQLFEYINYDTRSSVYAVMSGTYYIILGDPSAIESKDTPILPVSFNWVRARKFLPNNEMPKAEIMV
ncbi:MAG: hypothetical protein M1385_00215 [Candidatus Marsarchaeota archaeon]|nr:hypothetical protein [Candidatus Marsarchaeota archaeon]